MKKIIKLTILTVIIINLNSCFLYASYAVNSVAQYSENYPHSVSEVYNVVLNKVQRKDIKITKNIFTSDEAVIDADINSVKYHGTFKINIVKITDNASTLTIKYDIFGDKSKSKEFLNNVKQALHN